MKSITIMMLILAISLGAQKGNCQDTLIRKNTTIVKDTFYVAGHKTFVSYVVNTKYKKYSLFWGLIKFKVKQR